MDPFQDENPVKLDFKTEFDNELDPKKYNTENFSFPSFKCGEVFVSNSASGQFELNCILCSRQFQKIKQFAKHILKDHLNSDLEHSIDDLVKDIEFATTSIIDNDLNDEIPETEEELTCEVNLSSFLENNKEFKDEKEETDNIDETTDEEENIENSQSEENSENSEEDEERNFENNEGESTRSNYSRSSYVSEESFKNEIRIIPTKVTEKRKILVKKLQCKYCNVKYLRQSNLTKHIKRKHRILVERDRKNKSPINKIIEKIKCNICGKETTKYKLIQHLRSHDDSRYTHKCETCGKLFISERSLDLHNRNLHLKERPYSCKFDKCNRAFVTEHGLIAHQKIHTNDRPFMCPICHKGFFRKTKLDYHFETHHINRQIFTCDECGKQFMNTKTLERHKICSHFDDKIVDEKIIKKSTNINNVPNTDLTNSMNDEQNDDNHSKQLLTNKSSSSAITTNIQQTITNKRGNYECTFCPLKFIYKANLTEHIIRKHNSQIDQTKLLAEKAEIDKRNATKPQSTAICDICGKETLKTRMRQHLRSHDNSRYTHKCDTCGKLFISEKSMNIHIRNLHLKDRPYPCKFDNCNKKFATENALNAHYQIHTCERQFKCNICDKGFFTQAKHDYHVKTYHINGRIYKCDECDKRFYENGSLQAHKICHSNEKPYACDECPARFPRERSLNIHKQSHSGIKEYFCKMCNKDYALYNGIYTHMKTHGISYSAAMEKGLAGQRSNT